MDLETMLRKTKQKEMSARQEQMGCGRSTEERDNLRSSSSLLFCTQDIVSEIKYQEYASFLL